MGITEKTAEGFYLRGTMKQLNKGDKRAAVFVDALFLWIYLAGVLGWGGSAFQITVIGPLLFLGLLPIAAGLSILSYGQRKVKTIGFTIWGISFLLFAVIFYKGILSGLNLTLNQAIDVIGQRFPYMWPTYGVSIEENVYSTAITFAGLWCSAFLGFLGLYLMRSGNRLLLGIHFVFLFMVQIILKVSPGIFWNAASVLAILAVWFRGHTQKLPAGLQRLASVGNLVVITISVLLIFGIMQIFWPMDSYEKNEIIENWKEEAFQGLEEIRYDGSSQILPEGDFINLQSFEPKEETVLKVTMSSPEAYYLRGFTGSVYTGAGWEISPDESLWEYRDLFYWLHDSGFYGQETLSLASMALGDAAKESQNLISIENVNGSSKYCYVPYELYSSGTEDALPYDSQKIGDEYLQTKGIKGSRTYAYTALLGQITNYASYAAKLLEPEKLNEAGSEYQKLEGYYNQFVYENYLDLSGTMRTELKKLVGDANIDGAKKHTDYAEAKQNILYILNSKCVYDEKLKENWDGSDFVHDFLNKTKTGYSVHYASAATLLFRYYGIPARYVEGYLVTPDDVKAMTANEPYEIDETHAHAWVEYYQDGVGWLPFETTPSYLNIMPKAEDYQDISGTASAAGTSQRIEEEEPEEEEDEGEEFDWLLVVEILLLIGIFIFALLLLSFLIYVMILRYKSKKAKLLFTSSDKREAVRSIFSYTMNILAVAGLQIRNTSLYRYGTPLEKMFDQDIRTKYEEVVTIRQEAVYSDHEITEEQRQVLLKFKDDIWKRVYDGSDWIQKFQLKYIYFL